MGQTGAVIAKAYHNTVLRCNEWKRPYPLKDLTVDRARLSVLLLSPPAIHILRLESRQGVCYAGHLNEGAAMSNVFFADVFALGDLAQARAALRVVRRQLTEYNEEQGDIIELFRSRAAEVPGGLSPHHSSGRVLPLVINASQLSPFIDLCWSSRFVQQGGVMVVVGLDVSNPTPTFGWINRSGVVFRQGWDIPAADLPPVAADGQVDLDGPHGADRMGEKLLRQFLAHPNVREFLASAQGARA